MSILSLLEQALDAIEDLNTTPIEPEWIVLARNAVNDHKAQPKANKPRWPGCECDLNDKPTCNRDWVRCNGRHNWLVAFKAEAEKEAEKGGTS